MMSLAQYERMQDDYAAREEAILALSEVIEEKILGQHIYQPGNTLNMSKTYWHMDDFTADYEMPSVWAGALIQGNALSLQEDMEEKFYNFCWEIAEQCIDEVQKLEAGL